MRQYTYLIAPFWALIFLFLGPSALAQTDDEPPPTINRSSSQPSRVVAFEPEKCRFGNPRNGKPEKIYTSTGSGWALDDSLLIAPEFVVLEDRYSNFMLAQKKVGNRFLHGAIDSRGQILIPFEWQHLERISYEATAILANSDKKCALLNQKGQFLQALEECICLSIHAPNGYMMARPGQLRFFDETGKMTFEGPYDWYYREVELPQKTQMAVKKGPFSGIIDSSGRALFPFRFAKIKWATEAVVCVADSTKAEGLTNWQGDVIVPPSLSHIHLPDENGLCSARNAAGKMGLLASDGRVIIPFEYNACWTDTWKKGLYRVEKDGRSGIFDATGKVIQPME